MAADRCRTWFLAALGLFTAWVAVLATLAFKTGCWPTVREQPPPEAKAGQPAR
jgi:hypothetical protein